MIVLSDAFKRESVFDIGFEVPDANSAAAEGE
jgi:hypothetical protein